MNWHPKDFTPQEDAIASVLSDLGLRYERQHQMGTRWADFWVEDSFVIEADGIYGHLKKADRKRDQELIDLGAECVVHVTETNPKKMGDAVREALRESGML